MATKRITFNKETLDRLPLPAPGKRSTFHDAKAPGLQLRITDKGAKTFYVRRWLTEEGKAERIALGKWPAVSLEEARKRAADINALVARGENPADKKRARREELTFSELFTEYLEHAKATKKTWREDQAKFRLYLPDLGRKKLSRVNRGDFAALHSEITRGAAELHQLKRSRTTRRKERACDKAPRPQPITANLVLALASRVFSWAIEAGLWTQANPVQGIRRNRPRSRDRFLQAGELRPFFDALAKEPDPAWRDFFLLCLLTGARRENVLSMRWEDLSLEEAVWRIPETKNGTPQFVSLSPEAVAVLRNRRPDPAAGFVFPGKGKRGYLREPKTAWRAILKRAGLADLRIHDLRRSLGSWQARTGASLVIVGKSLGHKSLQSTAIYARLDLDPVRASVDRATAAMLEAAGLKEPAQVVALPVKTAGGGA